MFSIKLTKFCLIVTFDWIVARAVQEEADSTKQTLQRMSQLVKINQWGTDNNSSKSSIYQKQLFCHQICESLERNHVKFKWFLTNHWASESLWLGLRIWKESREVCWGSRHRWGGGGVWVWAAGSAPGRCWCRCGRWLHPPPPRGCPHNWSGQTPCAEMKLIFEHFPPNSKYNKPDFMHANARIGIYRC